MSKQYGLILPGQPKKPLGRELPARDAATKPSIFDESSDSDGKSSDDGRPQLSARKPPVSMGPGAMERRMARRMQEQALKEDPTVFQYDELYDEMESKREAEQEVKSKEPKKPKYIERLMVTAEKRKLENELRIERQVQKEREQEGEEFKDKEAFVTAAYRKKLEEMRKMQEDEKRDEYLEAIGDVTKQQNIDGFYRHLYEQKMGIRKEVNKPEYSAAAEDPSKDDEEAAYKPIKSGKVPQQRAYRKRKSSDEEEDDPTVANTSKEGLKVHLQNNMDADSDFSIDSSTSESDDEESGDENKAKNKTKKTKETAKADKPADDKREIENLDSAKIALNLDTLKKPKDEPEDTKNENIKENEASSVKKEATPPPPPKPKIDKTLIWKKRTVGEVFDAAVQRYFERKAARSSA